MTFPLCAVYSRQINEPLAGSIGQADAYFLLESYAACGGQALAESTVPSAVVQHLARIPHSNCVLIRQPERPADCDGVLRLLKRFTPWVAHIIQQLDLEENQL